MIEDQWHLNLKNLNKQATNVFLFEKYLNVKRFSNISREHQKDKERDKDTKSFNKWNERNKLFDSFKGNKIMCIVQVPIGEAVIIECCKMPINTLYIQ